MPRPQNDFVRQETQWRRLQEDELRAPDGWLAVAALVWLAEGNNPLPEPYRTFGSFRMHRGKVDWIPAGGAARPVRPDTEPPADMVEIGDAQAQVLKRGKRIGVRIRDPKSPARTGFGGRIWYPADPAWRIDAEFHPYPKGRTLAITNVLGDVSNVPCPGYVTFTIGNVRCRLEPQETPNGLFVVFTDKTAGKGTYPAGRFLETSLPADGRVVLDFNRAVNPPCAFTDFATCPLPPRANRLRIAVPAGERHTGHH